MLATPSMLQSGFSRELFEAWAGNPRNTVLIVDFAVQGTLARQLLDSPQTVTTRDNRPVGVECVLLAAVLCLRDVPCRAALAWVSQHRGFAGSACRVLPGTGGAQHQCS